MIKKLIVNADDFGMCEGNTIGILLAHKNGILTSTTVMMNMPYASFALKQAQNFPDLGVGVHLNITIGKPLTQMSCVDENGYFLRRDKYENNQPKVNQDELYKEWKMQIEKYIEIVGHLPTHLDSHHHVHMLPWHIEVAKRLANEYNVPLRQREKVMDPYARCDDTFEKDHVTYEYLKSIINCNDETIEIMCHPGLIDQRLYDISSYNLPRMKELEILTSKEIKDFISKSNIKLINFTQI